MNMTPEQRLHRQLHTEVTAMAIPAWRGVEYYKASPSDADERSLKKVRLWQGDDRGFVLDTMLDGKNCPAHWSREFIMEIATRIFSRQIQNRYEVIIQKIVWYGGFCAYNKDLKRRIERAKQRVFAE